ncbi:MAG: sigma 54-interacting transcriptional regulator [Gemmatimonadales bacterium]
MSLRAIRISANLAQQSPERCELGPDLAAALATAKATTPIAFVLREDDAAQLDGCRDLIVDRGRKHPAKPLGPMLLGQRRIPFVRGGHTSPGQLLRSIRTLLAHAIAQRDGNVFLVGVAEAAFGELWARAVPLTSTERRAPSAERRVPSAEPPSRPAVQPSMRPAAERPSTDLFSLLPELPVPETVRERFIGDSPEASLVLQLLLRAARQDEPVLLLGDTGTGKEVVARLIHDQSSRRLQTFTAVNCGAIPRELLESELFGYEKGAHSTATARKVGLWQRADGGTLFLDEIADLSLDHQVKILRALEHGEIRPVGAEREIKVDARVVAATNRDLFAMMQGGDFREDLYYRLRAFMIRTPALRDHPADIPLLAAHLWRSITRDAAAKLPPDLIAELSRYRWPGNARELRMVLSSLFGLFGSEQLTARHLQAVFELEGQAGAARTRPPVAGELELHRVECLRHLRRADEVLRAAQVALRPLRGGREPEGADAASLPSTLEQRVSELELLCLRPLLFHGEAAFGAVRRVKDRLKALVATLRAEPAPMSLRGREDLEPDFGFALTTIFREVQTLLDAAAG